MSGFEVIVRPVVFPNIRPAPPRVLAPADDPEQGIAVISGSSGRLIDLTRNWSVSVTQQKPQQESKRVVDVARVYQVDEDGKINKKNYVDLEYMKKTRLETEQGPIKVIYHSLPIQRMGEDKLDNNYEIIQWDKVQNFGPPAA